MEKEEEEEEEDGKQRLSDWCKMEWKVMQGMKSIPISNQAKVEHHSNLFHKL